MGLLSYAKTVWKAGRAGGTPFTPDRFNNIEDGIEQATNELNEKEKRIEDLETSVENINSNLLSTIYEIITRDECKSIPANTATQIASIIVPAHSMIMLTINVNNMSTNPNFKLGLSLNSTEEPQIRWGELHQAATLYCSYDTTINVPNNAENALPLYAWIKSNMDTQVRYIFLNGISVPMTT